MTELILFLDLLQGRKTDIKKYIKHYSEGRNEVLFI
jgi:hypothetical protein